MSPNSPSSPTPDAPREASSATRSPARRRTFRRRSPWITTPLKLLFSLALTLLLIEVALRVVGIRRASREVVARSENDLHPLPFIAEAQRRGWIPWPNETRIIEGVDEHPLGRIEMRRNAESCREDEDTPLEKPVGTKRIIVLGDSHTDGFCFNAESFANQLEKKLTAVDVVNAGFELSSPYQQWFAYDQVFRKFQPDQVLMTFYAGNDFLELQRTDDRVHLRRAGDEFVHAEPSAGTDATRPGEQQTASWRAWARDHLAIYEGLRRVSVLRRLVQRATEDPYHDRLLAAQELHRGPVWQGLNQAYYFQHHASEWDEAVARQRWVLTTLRDACQRDGIRLTLVILPTLRQIHPQTDREALNKIIATLQLTEDSLACDERACQATAELARELRIKLLDLREPFRRELEKEPKKSLFYRFDHHLNVAGHQLLAELLRSAYESEMAIDD